eukprot:TRINITY_DN4234_c3_g1_i1.p1 TRINITY_DN4234_c3_g1~~TRINITY_DN4234_c3_g1_i1.p1  ORF type:complete len:835 (-),score=104.09 TRINITY_DN4234_c3_g1_i1:1759-4263(-)
MMDSVSESLGPVSMANGSKSGYRLGRQGSLEIQNFSDMKKEKGRGVMLKDDGNSAASRPLDGLTRNMSLRQNEIDGADKWQPLETGELGTHSYHLYLRGRSSSAKLSPWNDIPLWTSDRNMHVICTTPKGMWAELETQQDLSVPPLKHRIAGGQLEHFAINAPYNHCMMPQTWADPELPNVNYGGLPFDSCPLEVVDIGMKRRRLGEVYAVRVLGGFAVIDVEKGILSWKIVALDLTDRTAPVVMDVADVNKKLPLMLEEVREWLRIRHVAGSGGLEPVFGLNERVADRTIAIGAVAQAHTSWQQLISSKKNLRSGWRTRSKDPLPPPIALSDPRAPASDTGVDTTRRVPDVIRTRAQQARPAFFESLQALVAPSSANGTRRLASVSSNNTGSSAVQKGSKIGQLRSPPSRAKGEVVTLSPFDSADLGALSGVPSPAGTGQRPRAQTPRFGGPGGGTSLRRVSSLEASRGTGGGPTARRPPSDEVARGAGGEGTDDSRRRRKPLSGEEMRRIAAERRRADGASGPRRSLPPQQEEGQGTGRAGRSPPHQRDREGYRIPTAVASDDDFAFSRSGGRPPSAVPLSAGSRADGGDEVIVYEDGEEGTWEVVGEEEEDELDEIDGEDEDIDYVGETGRANEHADGGQGIAPSLSFSTNSENEDDIPVAEALDERTAMLHLLPLERQPSSSTGNLREYMQRLSPKGALEPSSLGSIPRGPVKSALAGPSSSRMEGSLAAPVGRYAGNGRGSPPLLQVASGDAQSDSPTKKSPVVSPVSGSPMSGSPNGNMEKSTSGRRVSWGWVEEREIPAEASRSQSSTRAAGGKSQPSLKSRSKGAL